MRLGSSRAVPAVLGLGIGLVVIGSLATTAYSNGLRHRGVSVGAGSGYTFAQSSIGGGGFVNVIAADPSGNGVMLAGSDTAGIQRSTDFGVTWQADQHGSITLAEHGVAALLFDPATPQTVYAATGGGIMELQDDGMSWAMLPAGPSFNAGNHSNPAGTSNLLERCTGRLLAVDDSTSSSDTVRGKHIPRPLAIQRHSLDEHRHAGAPWRFLLVQHIHCLGSGRDA